jgi:hypothetical protein
MLKKLTKIANKLDRLGYTKEADLLDKVIYKMAAMGEGSPAYMSAGTGDSDLQVNEEGEMEYPEDKTIMRSREFPSVSILGEEEEVFKVARELFNLLHNSIWKTWNLRKNYSDDIFNLEEKINKIKKALIRNYANDLDSRDDVEESIESLLNVIAEDRAEKWSTPYSTEWAFFGEEEYHLLDMCRLIIKDVDLNRERLDSDSARYYLLRLVNSLIELKTSDFDRTVKAINISKDTFEELEREGAYTEMVEIAEIIDPAAEFVYHVDDIVSSALPGIESAYKKLISISRFEDKKLPADYTMPGWSEGYGPVKGYETSPEQAQFEQSQIPMGRADVGDLEDLDWYTSRESDQADFEDEEDEFEDED